MIIKIELLEDAIFGSGISVPGEEDSSINYDANGFPYLRGSTFRGLLREETENYCEWINNDEDYSKTLFGTKDTEIDDKDKIYISDFRIPPQIKSKVTGTQEEIINAFTYIRTFTAIDNETGLAKDGSLRSARCIKKGCFFVGEINGTDENEAIVKEIIPYVKWIGSMKTRGLGKVKVTVCEEGVK